MLPRSVRQIVLCALLLLGSGCIGVGELREEVITVDPQGADSVQVSVTMGAGELDLSGGQTTLMEANFETNVDGWMPRVDYRVKEEGSRGILSVSNDENAIGIPFGEVENQWEVVLTEHLPLDLHVDLGVGEGHIDISRLQINRLHVDMGIGELRVDLSRRWDQDLQVSIDAGVGEVRIIVPRSVGVRVHAEAGIGSVAAPGFERVGAELQNAAHGSSPVTIDISVDIGIGEVRIQESDEEFHRTRSMS